MVLRNIKTESGLAVLFAEINNKVCCVKDEEYGYNQGAAEHKKAREKTKLKFSLSERLGNKMFIIFRAE